MKKVVLIGDSIRMGYDVLVREAFKDTAKVYFPYDNSRFTAFILRHLHEWKNEMQCGDDVDCVHWNVGAWDTLTLFEDGPLTPIDVYEQYTERLCKRIKILFPKAKVIFATTTPVHEALYSKISIRYNMDIEKYNEVAVRVVKKHGHEINDLYALMKDKPLNYHSDCTHYYSKKSEMLIAPQVCEAISKAINAQYGNVDFDKWFDETDSYDGVAWVRRRAVSIKADAELGI